MSIASYYADSDDNMKCTILVANWTSINVHIACQVIEHPRRCHVHTHTQSKYLNTLPAYESQSTTHELKIYHHERFASFQLRCTCAWHSYSSYVLMGCKFWSIPLIQFHFQSMKGQEFFEFETTKIRCTCVNKVINLWLASMVSLTWSWYRESEWKQSPERGHVRLAINTWNSTTTGLSI